MAESTVMKPTDVRASPGNLDKLADKISHTVAK